MPRTRPTRPPQVIESEETPLRSVRLTKGRISAATASVAGITSAVAVFALNPAPAQAAPSSPASAAGITATGAVNLSAIPAVSAGDATTDKSLATLPASAMPLSASLLHVQAGDNWSRASVADIQLANQLSVHLVTATCNNGVADSKLVDAVIAGNKIEASVAPNTTIAVPPGQGALTQVILNKQVPDGNGSVKVTAIEVNLNVAGVAETVDVSTADCAGTTSTGTGSAPPPAAPAPKPAKGDLSVTG